MSETTVRNPHGITVKLRVAAYVRVATDNEEPTRNFDLQVRHYTEHIQSQPDWEFVGLYGDKGVSGLNAKNRPEFRRLLSDCRAGLIDRVLVKSISRFSRNAVEMLATLRELKALGGGVYFENENLSTLSPNFDTLLTLFFSIAEEEYRIAHERKRCAQ